MKKSTNLIAFLIAFSLHVLLGGLLLMNVDFSLPKKKPKEAVSIIDASLISQQTLDDLAERKTNKKLSEQRKKDNAKKKKEREKADKKRKELEKKRKDELIKKQKLNKIKAEKADSARKEKEAKRLVAEKMLAEKKAKQKKADEKKALAKKKEAEKVKAEKVKAEKVKAEKAKAEKAKAEKVKAEKAKAKKAKAEKAKAEKAKAEKERLRQSELDKQMEAEFSDDFSSARSAKQLSEIAKYEALIRKKISRYWKVDPNMNGKSCTLAIRLAPDGLVISANMSRGDKKLCDSARRATLQAKTLPIPKDPELAPQFQDFDITLEPDL